MDNMIKFYRGLVANLPATGVNGALYITTDEGAIYYGTGDGMKRLGDFIQVANVAALPEKAHESCLYYCVAENILAKWNGSEWKQINKQPTATELKTLLGLGSLAYLSEVGEDNLNAALKEKVNAASGAQHSHDNKTVLDGITSAKVSAWDAAEQNAKDHADGLNTAMNTRVEALEAVDHTHGNKELLDTYTQTEANLADAVAKKHAHTFNETELNKIVEGDVAKWNGVAADHLTSADKTTLENAIKEAKKAGTDANTNIETYKVANDARVLAVEEDVAEIVDGTNGILAQAKSYSDGKLATARTEITAEIDGDVKVVNDALEAYKTSNDAALAGVKATADAAAVKTEVEAELAKKVDKEGYIAYTQAEKDKLAGISEGANKVEKSETNGNIKVDGQEVVVYTHPEKHAIGDVTGLQDALDGKQAAGNYSVEGHKHVKADITDFAHTHVASEITDLDTTIKGYDYATKTELGDVDKKFENYNTKEAQKAIDDEQDRRLGVIEGDYLKAADIANFETKENVKKVADDLAAYVTSNDTALAGLASKVGTVEEGKTVVGLIGENTTAIEGLDGRVETAEGEIDALQEQIKGLSGAMHFVGTYDELPAVANPIKVGDEINTGDILYFDEAKMSAFISDFLASNPEPNTTYSGGEKEYVLVKIVSNDTSGTNNICLRTANDDTQYRVYCAYDCVYSIMSNYDANPVATWSLAPHTVTEVEEGVDFVSINGELGGETFVSGDVIAVGDKEYVFNGTEFVEFGDISAEGERLTALEEKVGEKTVAEQVAEAKTYANGLNTAMDTRVKVLEGIDHEAYVAADTALKTELEGKIADGDAAALEAAKVDAANKSAVVLAEAQTYADGKVTALAEGQVATNKQDIADLLAQMSWGEF